VVVVRIPVDLSNLTLIAGSEPAGVLDMERRPRADKATGELLWQLDLVVIGLEDGAEVWPTRVAGEPKGISPGQLLHIEGLTALRWEMEGRHGTSFRARVIEAARPASAKSSVQAA
jgi:hypothetical protein